MVTIQQLPTRRNISCERVSAQTFAQLPRGCVWRPLMDFVQFASSRWGPIRHRRSLKCGPAWLITARPSRAYTRERSTSVRPT